MRTGLFALAAGLAGFLLAAVSGGEAAAERRVALVVGNAAYQNATTLSNTLNDAKAITALFTKAGFDVIESKSDLGVLEFKRAVRDFMYTAQDADIAVVYFAGHGIEIRGSNYLIPVDARLRSDYDADDEAVSLERVMFAVESVKQLRLIILDACRDNPFMRRMQRTLAVRAATGGLATVEPSTGNTLVAYAAQAGSLSYDGVGPNSPFTTALVKHIAEPGLDIRIALGRVRDEVKKLTGNRQEPVVYGSLGGNTIALVKAPAAPQVASANREIQRDYEFAERVGTEAAWESFLQTYSAGYHASLARAQLAKLKGAAGKAAPPVLASREPQSRESSGPAAAKTPPPPANPASRPAQEQQARVEPKPPPPANPASRPAQEQQARLDPKPPPPANPAVERAPAAVIAADPCKDEQDRLARLRANPARDDVLKLEKELRCERLRAQVVRLRESVVGPLPAAATDKSPVAAAGASGAGRSDGRGSEDGSALRPDAKTASPNPPASARRAEESGRLATAGGDACERDQERLKRLRAAPVRDEVIRFERDLACARLRPQVQRLRESVAAD